MSTFDNFLRMVNPNFPPLGAADQARPVPKLPMPVPKRIPMQTSLPSATESLQHDVKDFGEASLLEKFPITVRMLGNVLSLPQQYATEAITGGKFSSPGNIPELQELFSLGTQSPQLGALITNIIADPLNLAFGGTAIHAALRGRLKATTIAEQLKQERSIKLLNRTEDISELFSAERMPLELLKKKAGTHVPVKLFHPVTGFKLDWGKLDVNPQLKQILADTGIVDAEGLVTIPVNSYTNLKDEFMKFTGVRNYFKYGQTGITFKNLPFEQLTGEPKWGFDFSGMSPETKESIIDRLKGAVSNTKIDYDPQANYKLLGLEGPGGQKLTPKEISLTQSWLNRPEDTIPEIKYVIQTARDTTEAMAVDRDRFKPRFENLLDDVHQNPALRQAVALAVDGVPLRDWSHEAREAAQRYGAASFRNKVSIFNSVLDDFIQNIKLEVPKSNKLMDPIARIAQRLEDNGDLLVPTTHADLLKGLRPASEKYDIVESVDHLLNSVLKRYHYDQGLDAIKEIRARVGVNKESLAAKFLDAFINNWKGLPKPEDRWLNRIIIDNDELYKKRGSFTDKLVKAMADTFVGTKEMSAVEMAKEKRATYSELSRKLRQSIYAGMLGGAFDSAIRNTTQLINHITEKGFIKAFEHVGALTNPKLQEAMKTENFIERTSNLLTEVLENQKVSKQKTVLDHMFSPFNFAEDLNRGASFYGQLEEELSKGVSIADAIKNAEDYTRKVQFGYSVFDMSPYLSGSPTTKLLFQFTNFPIRQLDLMLGWAKNPINFKSKMIRFLAMTGAVVANANRVGVSMGDVLGFGYGFSEYPPFVSLEADGLLPRNINFVSESPLIKATTDLGLFAKDLATLALTGTSLQPQTDPHYSPTRMWKSLASLFRYGAGMAIGPLIEKKFGKTIADNVAGGVTLLTGRYAQKIYSNVGEWLYNDNPEVRKRVSQDPGFIALTDALGVSPDPGVNWADRTLRLLGFKSVRDKDRKEFMNFLGNFQKRYTEAIKELNTAVIEGGDVGKLRTEWQTRIANQFGGPFRRWGVPDYVLINAIRPSPHAYTAKTLATKHAPAELRKLQGLPVELRDRILPQVMKNYE